MRRNASLIAVALLGVLGCQGGTSVEQETATVVVTTTPTPTPTLTQNEPTPEEQLLRSIMSCDVREIVFGHGAVTYIKFRGGERYARSCSEENPPKRGLLQPHTSNAARTANESSSESSTSPPPFRNPFRLESCLARIIVPLPSGPRLLDASTSAHRPTPDGETFGDHAPGGRSFRARVVQR
jgi:hypothetical protein